MENTLANGCWFVVCRFSIRSDVTDTSVVSQDNSYFLRAMIAELRRWFDSTALADGVDHIEVATFTQASVPPLPIVQLVRDLAEALVVALTDKAFVLAIVLAVKNVLHPAHTVLLKFFIFLSPWILPILESLFNCRRS